MSDLVILAVGAGVFGAIVGSFLNVVIYRTGVRLAEEFARVDGVEPPGAVRSSQFGQRSMCPYCGAPIAARHNLPIIGWLLLRGRAACCGARISARYPFVEALTAAGFAGIVFVAAQSDRASGAPVLAGFLFAFFVADLIANTFIDFDHQILPDKLTRPLLAVGLFGGAAVGPDFAGGLWTPIVDATHPIVSGLLASVAGALCGWSLTLTIRTLGTAAFAQEAMGLGDVKLMMGVGAFLGWPGALLTFFLGSLIGAVVGVAGRLVGLDTHKIAFGPYLAIAALAVLYGDEPLMVFATRTLPQWWSGTLEDPRVAFGAFIVCVVLLVWTVRRGRSRGRRPEESQET